MPYFSMSGKKMRDEEKINDLINHQIDCLRMAQRFEFLLLFDPENREIEIGMRLWVKFANRARFRAREIEAGRVDPASYGKKNDLSP